MTILYIVVQDISNNIRKLKHDTGIVLKGLKINSLNANPKKFQSMILGKRMQNKITLKISYIEIYENHSFVLLDITVAKHLKFSELIENVLRLANFKVRVLRRIRN